MNIFELWASENNELQLPYLATHQMRGARPPSRDNLCIEVKILIIASTSPFMRTETKKQTNISNIISPS